MVGSSTQDGLLEAFRQELLRWNRQINLVSRQETEDRLESLFAQCRSGVPVVEAWLNEGRDKSSVWYFDLGSGGGLPGVLWHVLLSAKFTLSTHLVEPREKRAWFLERIGTLSGMPPFQVVNGRWGDGLTAVSGPPADSVVVSLKALKLTDDEVLAGLVGFVDGGGPAPGIMIARYFPPKQVWSKDVADSLSVPPPGQVVECGRAKLISVHSGVVNLGPAAGSSLVVSSYRLA